MKTKLQLMLEKNEEWLDSTSDLYCDYVLSKYESSYSVDRVLRLGGVNNVIVDSSGVHFPPNTSLEEKVKRIIEHKKILVKNAVTPIIYTQDDNGCNQFFDVSSKEKFDKALNRIINIELDKYFWNEQLLEEPMYKTSDLPDNFLFLDEKAQHNLVVQRTATLRDYEYKKKAYDVKKERNEKKAKYKATNDPSILWFLVLESLPSDVSMYFVTVSKEYE